MSRMCRWLAAGMCLLSILSGCAPAPAPSNAAVAKGTESVAPAADDEVRISELMESSEDGDSKSKDGFATVPPGHKIAVIKASETAEFGTSESGIRIAQMGKHDVDQRILSIVKDFAVDSDGAHLIWIMAPEFIDSLSDHAGFMAEVKVIVVASNERVTHAAVFPGASPQHQSFIKQIRGLGMSTYSAADDGACFVEVHRPDGIVVGMPGKGLTD